MGFGFSNEQKSQVVIKKNNPVWDNLLWTMCFKTLKKYSENFEKLRESQELSNDQLNSARSQLKERKNSKLEIIAKDGNLVEFNHK